MESETLKLAELGKPDKLSKAASGHKKEVLTKILPVAAERDS
jgi:hypothetical protein